MPHIATRKNLARLLAPTTVAVVGANDQLGMSNNAVRPMLAAGREVILVNPRRDTVYERSVFTDLTTAVHAGVRIDAVLSLVSADRSIELIEEAATLGCAGVVIAAAGFAEAGEEGLARQQLLLDVADRTGLAVIGPNCAGFKNVPLGVNLFTGGWLKLPVSGLHTIGGVSMISQSGFLVRSAMAAAGERHLGVSIAVSSGNEAVCDLADYLAVLAEDPHTSVICLIIETIRRPSEFFTAVAAARAAGKPVIALKLGRSERSKRIMQSHTGAIADDSWVYELAFRDHGVISARDIDDLLDRAQLFVQLPSQRHQRMDRIGLITTSGGVATLATDIAEELQVVLPELQEIENWIRERVPGDTVNPHDLTGFVMSKAELMEEVFDKYAEHVDILGLGWWAGAQDEGWAATLLDPFSRVAQHHEIPFVVTPIEATSIGDWVSPWRHKNLSFARGMESFFRAVHGMNIHVSTPPYRLKEQVSPGLNRRVALPKLIDSEVGRIVGFAEAMQLLSAAGIEVAPWIVIDEGETVDSRSLGDQLVVKLADVAHRTEIGAVRVGVAHHELSEAVAEMRSIAAKHDVSPRVAVQAMISGHAEAFAGLQCQSGLGPLVLLGAGGVLIEVLHKVSGRFLPIDEQDLESLVDEVVSSVSVLRGQKPWSRVALGELVAGLNRLWLEHGDWLDSVDLNPLIITSSGVVAVDALLVAR